MRDKFELGVVGWHSVIVLHWSLDFMFVENDYKGSWKTKGRSIIWVWIKDLSLELENIGGGCQQLGYITKYGGRQNADWSSVITWPGFWPLIGPAHWMLLTPGCTPHPRHVTLLSQPGWMCQYCQAPVQVQDAMCQYFPHHYNWYLSNHNSIINLGNKGRELNFKKN